MTTGSGRGTSPPAARASLGASIPFLTSQPHSRQRDLLPLPLVRSGLNSCNLKSLSRSVARRHLQQQHQSDLVLEIARDLNSLFVGPAARPCLSAVPTSAQAHCLAQLGTSVRRVGAPPADLDGSGALRELRAKHGYDGESATIAP